MRVILLIALLSFALPLPTALAAGCVFHDTYDIGAGADVPGYVRFPSSNFVKGGRTAYRDASCQTSAGFTIHFSSGAAHAGSRSSAMKICQANNSRVVTNAWQFRSTGIYQCEVGDETYTGSGGNGNRNRSTSGPPPDPGDITVHHSPVAGGGGLADMTAQEALATRYVSVHSNDGMNSGIQFRRLTNWGVGDPAVIDMGYLDAVDIWSHIGGGYEICFPQIGRIVFLDASISPRSLAYPEYSHNDGWTCASLDRAGTMVLVNAPAGADGRDGTITRSETTTGRPGTYDSINDAIALEGCSGTTQAPLRIRQAPWGRIIAVIPRGAEVQASARTKSWFKVTYQEVEGWSAAWHISDDGGCDWPE